MTGPEMVDAFLLQYDINGSAAVAGFEDDEIYDFLNKAQLDLIRQVYYTKGPEPIANLIDNQQFSLNDAPLTWPNTYRVDEPSDFLFYIASRVYLTRSDYPVVLTNTWVDTNIIKYEDVYKFTPEGENIMIFYNPVSYLNSKSISVIIDSFTSLAGGDNFIVSYVRKPGSISNLYGPAINEKWHQEIVDLAVKNAILVTNDVRIRTASQAKQTQKQ